MNENSPSKNRSSFVFFLFLDFLIHVDLLTVSLFFIVFVFMKMFSGVHRPSVGQ